LFLRGWLVVLLVDCCFVVCCCCVIGCCVFVCLLLCYCFVIVVSDCWLCYYFLFAVVCGCVFICLLLCCLLTVVLFVCCCVIVCLLLCYCFVVVVSLIVCCAVRFFVCLFVCCCVCCCVILIVLLLLWCCVKAGSKCRILQFGVTFNCCTIWLKTHLYRLNLDAYKCVFYCQTIVFFRARIWTCEYFTLNRVWACTNASFVKLYSGAVVMWNWTISITDLLLRGVSHKCLVVLYRLPEKI